MIEEMKIKRYTPHTEKECRNVAKRIIELQQENQKKLHTSNGNEFTKYELLDDYERILQENQRLKQWDKNKDTRNSRQRVANYELLKENKRLKEENIKLQMKYISVLDEIKEQLKLERKLALSLNKPYTISVIDKLLDKVKQ